MVSILRGTGYELIYQSTQEDELTDRKAWNCSDREVVCRRTAHPIGDLIKSAMWLWYQEVVDAIMHMVSDNQHGPTGQRMKWIGNKNFECQKPSIMTPARTVGRNIGR